MKVSVSQRRVYLLSILLLLITCIVCVIWGFGDAPEDGTAPDATRTADVSPTPNAPEDAGTTAAPVETAAPEAGMYSTVVYYQDNYGYLVPVMRSIKAETGVAKATLKLMVKSLYNDMEAARLGMRTVLPEDISIDLDVSPSGVARIDLGKQALQMADEVSERNMVNAVVQTLTEFPTVSVVQFLIDGKQMDALPHGTRVAGDFTRGMLNPETTPDETNMQGTPVTLYFSGDSTSLVVPVTRMVYGQADIDTAVLELVKGPSTASPLDNVLPKGCGLIGVTVENGVARLNFTPEFIEIAKQTDGGRLALRALMLTCTQFEGIKSVEVLVDGEPFDPGEGTLTMPTFVNSASEIANALLQNQSAEIFETD